VSAESASCDTITFRVCPRRVLWPRRGEPWTKAEDDQLLRLMAEAECTGCGAGLTTANQSEDDPEGCCKACAEEGGNQ
jgi:hypothetical protein